MSAGRAFAVLILSTVSASFALAQPAPPVERKAAPKGLVVFIDPVTGKIRQPEAAEIEGLVSPPAAPGAAAPLVERPLVMKYGPAGAVGVVLDSRFESFMVVTKKPDGTLSMDCLDGKKKADEAVAATTTHAKPARVSDGKEAVDVR